MKSHYKGNVKPAPSDSEKHSAEKSQIEKPVSRFSSALFLLNIDKCAPKDQFFFLKFGNHVFVDFNTFYC